MGPGKLLGARMGKQETGLWPEEAAGARTAVWCRGWLYMEGCSLTGGSPEAKKRKKTRQ